MTKANYWDLLIYITPEKLQSMPSDCGDSYDDKNRDNGYTSLQGMMSLMQEHGPPFTNQDHSSFGSDKTMNTMREIMEKGASIIIDPKGEMRIIPGDAINERTND